MIKTRTGWLMGAALLFTTACDSCVEPPLGELDAFVNVDACNTTGTADCVADFGGVGQGFTQTVTIMVRNEKLDINGNFTPGEKALTISSIKLADNTDPAFSLVGEIPTTVKEGKGVEINVKFSPQTASVFATQLFITTNGANKEDPTAPIVVNINGTGQEQGMPNLTIMPADCNFGEVAVGATAYCDVSLGNITPAGRQGLSLSVTMADFSPDTAQPEFIAPTFPVPFELPPGAATTMRIGFRPSDIIQYSGKVRLTTTDPNHLAVEIPLHGSGGAAPTAVARVESINGQPTSAAAPQVQPLDNVVLTGADSVAGTTQRTITGYLWEWVSKPMESTAILSTPNAMTTGFSFNSSNVTRPGLDVAGTYVVKLTVTDDSGARSSNMAQVTLNAVPSEDLHLQLTWEDASSDLDLHLVRNIGPRFTAEDCYYANCKQLGYTVNWGTGGANPHLDVDDTNGFGPENINVAQPRAGNYTAGVHWYSGHASSIVATVKVYVQGALLGEYTREMSACNQYWEVAKVIWGATGTATVQQINNTAQETRGSCF